MFGSRRSACPNLKISAQEKHIRAELDRAARAETARKKKERANALADALKAIEFGEPPPELEARIAKVQAIRVPRPLLPEARTKKAKTSR